jgi:hypothetical protein
MSRRIRSLMALCAVSFALATVACADTTAPSQAPSYGSLGCDVNNPNVCK